MVKDKWIGLIKTVIQETGYKAKEMEKVYSLEEMEILMMVNGRMIKFRDMESLLDLMEIDLREIGLMIKLTVLEHQLAKMEKNI